VELKEIQVLLVQLVQLVQDYKWTGKEVGQVILATIQTLVFITEGMHI
jgi:hypothetical protein